MDAATELAERHHEVYSLKSMDMIMQTVVSSGRMKGLVVCVHVSDTFPM